MSIYAFHDDKSKCNLDDYLDKISDNDNLIQAMKGDISNIDDSIVNVNRSIGDINDDIGDINDDIDGINDSIQGINGDVQSLQNRVVGIEKGGTSGTTARAARRALGLNYDSGDVISGTFYGAGYVTGAGKYFVFEIPLSKVIDGDLFLVNMKVTIRQGGYYIFGTASDDGSVSADVKSIATITKIDGGIMVELKPSSAPAHVSNNDAFAVLCITRINIV